jgi:cytochrome P450
VLAIILHPEVQSKAQQELDLVTGSARLPDFQDRNSLPYISAIVKEVFRSVTHVILIYNYLPSAADGVQSRP